LSRTTNVKENVLVLHGDPSAEKEKKVSAPLLFLKAPHRLEEGEEDTQAKCRTLAVMADEKCPDFQVAHSRKGFRRAKSKNGVGSEKVRHPLRPTRI